MVKIYHSFVERYITFVGKLQLEVQKGVICRNSETEKSCIVAVTSSLFWTFLLSVSSWFFSICFFQVFAFIRRIRTDDVYDGCSIIIQQHMTSHDVLRQYHYANQAHTLPYHMSLVSCAWRGITIQRPENAMYACGKPFHRILFFDSPGRSQSLEEWAVASQLRPVCWFQLRSSNSAHSC